MTYIFGHTTPDSDSIVGAISLSYLRNQLGFQSIPTRQGDMNPESKFILEKFGFNAPKLQTTYANQDVYLVDHSDLAQSPKDIQEANIIGIVDHHKLGDITTSAPLECWIRPVGCSNTIIKEMYDYYKIEIPQNIASIMLCAILSDTVIFKSPTCTKADTKAVKELSKIAQIEDYKALGMEMFTVKSDVKSATPRELILRDFKDFVMSGKKVGIGQLEVVDLSLFDNMKDELHSMMKIIKENDNRDMVMLLLTDIIKEGSQILVSGDEAVVEKAFDVKLENSEVWIDGVMSRKKQIIPFLESSYK
ncbi:Manganese-dependent inorganic pyrophosphatase [hydrothermal vent metagenome]|uniref:inorganic diphosphatase n=1 Tax=hydrothermal vent metagenome TaxID=652676 RepID=A0A1W1EK37_9ZZZZ